MVFLFLILFGNLGLKQKEKNSQQSLLLEVGHHPQCRLLEYVFLSLPTPRLSLRFCSVQPRPGPSVCPPLLLRSIVHFLVRGLWDLQVDLMDLNGQKRLPVNIAIFIRLHGKELKHLTKQQMILFQDLLCVVSRNSRTRPPSLLLSSVHRQLFCVVRWDNSRTIGCRTVSLSPAPPGVCFWTVEAWRKFSFFGDC